MKTVLIIDFCFPLWLSLFLQVLQDEVTALCRVLRQHPEKIEGSLRLAVPGIHSRLEDQQVHVFDR